MEQGWGEEAGDGVGDGVGGGYCPLDSLDLWQGSCSRGFRVCDSSVTPFFVDILTF